MRIDLAALGIVDQRGGQARQRRRHRQRDRPRRDGQHGFRLHDPAWRLRSTNSHHSKLRAWSWSGSAWAACVRDARRIPASTPHRQSKLCRRRARPRVCNGLTVIQRGALDALLVVDAKTQRSIFAALCTQPGRPSRKNLDALIERYEWLMQLSDPVDPRAAANADHLAELLKRCCGRTCANLADGP